MTGMSRYSGKALSLLDHIIQSINDILTTPIGTRIMRPTYGSYVFELVDAPFHTLTKQRLIAATVDAITRWEPRVTIERVLVDIDKDGRVGLWLDGIVNETAQKFTTKTSLQSGAA